MGSNLLPSITGGYQGLKFMVQGALFSAEGLKFYVALDAAKAFRIMPGVRAFRAIC